MTPAGTTAGTRAVRDHFDRLAPDLELLRPHERGQLRNSVESIGNLVGRHFHGVTVEVRQPLPLSRVLPHHRFGLPRLGRSRSLGAGIDRVERSLAAVMPRRRWACIVARVDGVEPARA